MPFARASYDAMAKLHRLLGSVGTIRRFIASETARLNIGRPLRILDLGAGDCRVAERVARWATRESMPVIFTCLDANPHAVSLARRRLRKAPALQINAICERVADHVPPAPYDCAVGSLFFHHLGTGEILELLGHLRTMVRHSVLISDLRRSSLSFMAFLALRPVVHPAVWRDGLMSIRRGFRAAELEVTLARLPRAEVRCRDEILFRVVGRVRYRR
jgi:2-polyprenyl-3-methyl-5-hydroxy-6-metoxy-1,4-benzoquinol methylase